ncbi:MAG: PorP/SprF family type IX secretion system membrane protein [Bacteroidota bacterium]
MKKIILLLLSFCCLQAVQAQDEAIFNHYLVNHVLINPASAGFNGAPQIQLNYRGQWSGFEDAPQTYMALFQTPVGKTFGLSAGVLTETAAQITRLRGQLNFGFRFPVGEHVKIAAGVSTEFQQMRVGNDIFDSNFFQLGDRLLDEFMDGKDVFDASLGFYGTIKDRTFVGLTFANLVRARLDNIVDDNQESFFSYYTFHAGHKFDIADLNFNLEPSILIRQIRDVPFQMDFNLKAGFMDDQLITGLSYRSLGSMAVLLGTNVSDFQIFYSYDVSFQRFQRFNMGSHEVTVAFTFRKKDRPAPEVGN